MQRGEYLPNSAAFLLRGSSAVMSTSMLPLKEGVPGLVRMLADKWINCCPPSSLKYWLTGNTGPTVMLWRGKGIILQSCHVR